MCEGVYDELKLTAVGCPAEVSLPNLEFVSEILGVQLDDIGMLKAEPRVTNGFACRDRNASDPVYSFDELGKLRTDILGLYSWNLRKPEITLYVDSCLCASEDLSIPLITCVGLCLPMRSHITLPHGRL